MTNLNPTDPITLISTALELLLLLTTLFISSAGSIQQVIGFYIWQSWLLAVLAVLTTIAKTPVGLLEYLVVAGLILWPIFLAISIMPLLARATVQQIDGKRTGRFALPFPSWRLLILPFAWLGGLVVNSILGRPPDRRVRVEWSRNEHSFRVSGRSLLMYMLLVALAFSVSSLLGLESNLRASTSVGSQTNPVGAMISLALYLIGLYNMVNKQDIITQVVGLLTMDQGMYLAVLKIVPLYKTASLFVVALFLYTLITIVILVIMLPQMRLNTRSIDLGEIAETSPLTEADSERGEP